MIGGSVISFKEIVAPTIKELFVREIEDMIISGELAIGDRLPSERELAERMKISKTAVHGGIADMVRMGFLEVVPRKGIFVGDYAGNGTLETLTAIMQHDGGSMDSRNVRSLMEMRYAVESVAIERLIAKGDGAAAARLRELTAEAREIAESRQPTDYRALAMLYFRYHHHICVASGNTIAPLIFNAFKTPSVTFWTNSSRALGPKESVDRLAMFTRYIEAGDTAGALRHLKAITDTAADIVCD